MTHNSEVEGPRERTEAQRRAAVQERFAERMTKQLIAEAQLDRQYAEPSCARAPVNSMNAYVPSECRRVDLDRYGYKEIELATKVPGSPSYLRWLRGEHGISRADLAEAAGVSTKTVARFETSEVAWANAHHCGTEATTAEKVRAAGVSAATEAAMRTALDDLIRKRAEGEAAGKERSEAMLVPRLYAENLAALRGMAYARARDIVGKEQGIRGPYATLYASDVEDIALAGLSHLLKRGDAYDNDYGKKRGKRQAKYTTWARGPIWTGCNTEAGRLRKLRGRDTTGAQLATLLPLDESLITESHQPNPKRKPQGHGPSLEAA
jgi:transcriptional regulator with XRE-family HTH domain